MRLNINLISCGGMRVAFYVHHSHLKSDGLFATTRVAGSYPVQPFVVLRDLLSEQGYVVHTHDMYSDPSGIDLVVVVDLPPSPSIVDGLRTQSPNARFVLYILESPPHHPGQFNSLNYERFDGVISYSPASVDCEKVFWCPIPCDQFERPRSSLPDWSERHFLVTVNSRKRAGFLCPSGQGILSRFGVRGFGEGWNASLRQIVRQWTGFRYSFRNEMVYWLDRNIGLKGDFHVYGAGWDGAPAIGYLERVFPAPPLMRSWKGVYHGCKSDLLSRYRYALIVENWIGEEGYVSEKIFEALQCGCIPVYWGDSSISELIPKDAWIDGNQFREPVQVLNYLLGESQEVWENRLELAFDFLGGTGFEPFTPEGYARRMSGLIRKISAGETGPMVPA